MDKHKERLGSLDGIRGIAIILVFLNHIYTKPILNALPASLHLIFNVITSSGRTGVSIFFLLSGFLMAYLYPKVGDKSAFLQKRYTRIFPLFISLVTTRMILKENPDASVIFRLTMILIPALVINLLWMRLVKKISLGNLFFKMFIALQILIGGIYIFWIMRHPAINFQQLPTISREGIIALVNATLTLPFGNYIPMLDGVYWSLVAEVFFYIIYPFTFAPLAEYLSRKNFFVIAFFIFSLMPFFLGAEQLSKRIMTLSMLDLPIFFYFVAGITLAYIKRQNSPWVGAWARKMRDWPLLSYVLFLLFIAIFFVLNILLNTVPESWKSPIKIVAAFPFALVMLGAIVGNSALAKIFEAKWLRFLGTISYSIYLIHNIVVDAAKIVYTPHGIFFSFLYFSVIFMVVCLISYATYILLEKPYLMSKKQKPSIYNAIPIKRVFLGIVAVYCVGILVAYQSNQNFFSLSVPHRDQKNGKNISLRKQPKVDFDFTATDNNLGIVTMNLHYQRVDDSTHQNKNPQQLEFRIKEAGTNSWYATSSYDPVQIGLSKEHPFGFPIISKSKGKHYIIELELKYPDSPVFMSIDTTEGSLNSVYQIDKYAVLKNPGQLLGLIISKSKNILLNSKAIRAWIYLIPFVVAFLLAKKSKSAI